uniref:Protein RegB n=1 Tax=Pseudomonas aeruginosa (strain ATCC 15692 / DSM 22644 / CIP 104116 / JCM 14847 / LMG 12228 / 1C / PRS 101 / PAO1) TaxID=208964 RepID=REGB_PSEAE|nr:RecName: Full=Protein RegB [Pseudomonas aeruginosa PAO1]
MRLPAVTPGWPAIPPGATLGGFDGQGRRSWATISRAPSGASCSRNRSATRTYGWGATATTPATITGIPSTTAPAT